MFNKLNQINRKPSAFEFYTARDLWTDSYRSQQMLQYHLNESIDVSSRNHKFINDSVDWICRNFDLKKGATIADFGCGPGLYTSRLAQKGLDVTGIDFSSNSIEYARKDAEQKKMKIRYLNQNYLDVKTDEKYDLILMIMCDFCALSPQQRQNLLGVFKAHLKEEGSVLLDVYSLSAFAKREEAQGYEKNHLNQFWSENDYYAFTNTIKYNQEKVVLDKYTIIEKDKTYTVYNWLQYFSKEQITQEFRQAGFKVNSFPGNVAGAESSDESDEFAVIARLN